MSARDEWKRTSDGLMVDGQRLTDAGALLAEAVMVVDRLTKDIDTVLILIGQQGMNIDSLVPAFKWWLEQRAEHEVNAQNALNEAKEARSAAERREWSAKDQARAWEQRYDRILNASRRRKTTLAELKRLIYDEMPTR